MDQDKSKALSKIRKCIALAASSNANEAATAMRQAQALMKMHGISEDLAEAVEMTRELVSGKTKAKTFWEMQIAGTVAASLGLKVVIHHVPKHQRNGKTQYAYLGPKQRVALAEYAHEMLCKSVIEARKAFLLTDEYIYSLRPAQATEDFVRGFSLSVKKAVDSLHMEDTEARAIVEFVKKMYADGFSKSRPLSLRSTTATNMGLEKGRSLRLDRPMSDGTGAKLRIGGN